MKLIRGLQNLQRAGIDSASGCVLTIGNFDGVHRGHQALLTRAVELAERYGVPATVLSFEPTPREYFSGERAPARVSNLCTKLLDLGSFGIGQVVLHRFGSAFAQLEATVFVRDVLASQLGVRAIVIGDDFRFGARRAGDLEMLRREGARLGFEVDGIASVCAEGLRCSSTALRDALAVPDLTHCEALLGRPYRLVGRVRGGLRLGRTLGMPTANVNLRRQPALRLGVYAVEARALNSDGTGGEFLPGVANLGVRPTLGLTRCLLETHLIDHSEDLYGRLLEVRFRQFLRPEQRFDDLSALSAQMQRDKSDAAAFFASKSTGPA
ncbi:bifunctional riboflavin kinase/FAD synthetase [Sinimarinibacterium sp. CAU 1509]|uniref:bifunctional riboflavin kinase/FAD synthetase n=1 Tax=Sinimarinibacterium sp. CAU 1509 TaxID=2562283 RepID=UPI0010AD1596|nr:bifunctional riboflavin kinase/FAD synthetase [Sinimarinibacterium sp. CAU 1509]TJY62067.1 bifunctional riboflavin kinase/FAD synthetase [Sinimarinibacterium sp. CAU 1509]